MLLCFSAYGNNVLLKDKHNTRVETNKTITLLLERMAVTEDDFVSLMKLYEATDDGLGMTLKQLNECKIGVITGRLCPKLGMPDRCLKQVKVNRQGLNDLVVR